MPLEIVLHKKVILSDLWVDKNDWDTDFRNNPKRLSELAALLNEDIYEFINVECGGLLSTIETAEWVD